jgi:hypothetical protein
MKKMTYKTKIGILALEIMIAQPKVGLWQRKFMVDLFGSVVVHKGTI